MLDGVADVVKAGADDRLRVVIRKGPLDGISWECLMVAEERRLRFVDSGRHDGIASEIVLDFREAQGGRGTEVTLRVKALRPGCCRAQWPTSCCTAPGAAADRGNTDHLIQPQRTTVGPLTTGGISMRALCWNGVNELSVETVDDPMLLNPHDVIVKVGLTTTCGSDLHFIDGYLPGMRAGDVFGHEFMGEVVDAGREVTDTRVGDRVVVPSFIACNRCWYCQHDLTSLCETTNPNAELQQPILGFPTGGIYGYTHPFGDTRVRMPSTSGCRSATPTALPSPTTSPTNRRCSCPTRCLPDTWVPTSARSTRATPWRCGERAVSG